MEYRPRLEKGALSKNAGLLMQLAPPLALLQPSQTVTVPKQRVLLGAASRGRVWQVQNGQILGCSHVTSSDDPVFVFRFKV